MMKSEYLTKMTKHVYFYLLPLLFAAGCTSSIVIDAAKFDNASYSMFGEIPSRSFYVTENIGDTLQLRWNSEINGSFSATSITASHDYIFASDLSGRVFAFDISNGKKLGELKLKGEIESAPLIDQIRIIFALNQYKEPRSVIHIYDFKRGKDIFEIEIPGNIKTELIKSGSEIYFIAENGTAYKYNVNSNKIWEQTTGITVHSNPALSSGKMIFGNDRGEIFCLNAENGSLIYKKKIGGTFNSGVMLSGPVIYCADGNGAVFALNENSGDVIWKFDTHYRITSTPVCDSTDLYIGNLRGDIYKLDLKTGKMKWKLNTGGVIESTPLVFEDYLVQPDLNKKVHFIDKNSGRVKRSMEFEGRVKLSPVYYRNTLFLGVDKGNLKAFTPAGKVSVTNNVRK